MPAPPVVIIPDEVKTERPILPKPPAIVIPSDTELPKRPIPSISSLTPDFVPASLTYLQRATQLLQSANEKRFGNSRQMTFFCLPYFVGTLNDQTGKKTGEHTVSPPLPSPPPLVPNGYTYNYMNSPPLPPPFASSSGDLAPTAIPAWMGNIPRPATLSEEDLKNLLEWQHDLTEFANTPLPPGLGMSIIDYLC